MGQEKFRHAMAEKHFRCDCLTSCNLLIPSCFLQGMWEKGNASSSGRLVLGFHHAAGCSIGSCIPKQQERGTKPVPLRSVQEGK